MRTSDYRARLHNAASFLHFLHCADSPQVHVLREATHQPGYVGKVLVDQPDHREQFESHEAYADNLIDSAIERTAQLLTATATQLEATKGFADRDTFERWCVEEFGLIHSPFHYAKALPDNPELLPEALDAWQFLCSEQHRMNGETPEPIQKLFNENVSDPATIFRAAHLQEAISDLASIVAKQNFDPDLQIGISRYSTPAREGNQIHENILFFIGKNPQSPFSAKDMAERITSIVTSGKNLHELEAYTCPTNDPDICAVMFVPHKDRHLCISDVNAMVDHVACELEKPKHLPKHDHGMGGQSNSPS